MIDTVVTETGTGTLLLAAVDQETNLLRVGDSLSQICPMAAAGRYDELSLLALFLGLWSSTSAHRSYLSSLPHLLHGRGCGRDHGMWAWLLPFVWRGLWTCRTLYAKRDGDFGPLSLGPLVMDSFLS